MSKIRTVGAGEDIETQSCLQPAEPRVQPTDTLPFCDSLNGGVILDPQRCFAIQRKSEHFVLSVAEFGHPEIADFSASSFDRASM